MSRGRGGRGGRGRGGRGGRGGGRGVGGRRTGASRGRGGRGMGGRGGRGGFGGRSQSPSDRGADRVAAPPKELDVNKDVAAYFVGNVTVDQHHQGQEQNRERYAAGMAVLQQNGVDVAQNARIRALASAWARHDYNMANAFLKDRDSFGLNEVLKAVSLLDSGRQIRVLEKKMKRLQLSAGKVKPQTLGKLKSDIDNLNKNKPTNGSASGAVCKHVREWVRAFSKEELEFYALHFPTEPWKKLADICHFHPKKDFEAMDWFLPFCYGSPAPDGSMVNRCREVKEDNVNDLLKEFAIPYAHVKGVKEALTKESKAVIAANEAKLDTVLWYYEELRCEEADKVILQRVEGGTSVTLPNGKLLERLLAMKMYRENITGRRYYYGDQEPEVRTVDEAKAPFYKYLLPIAQKKMDAIKLSLESPVVVIGDASGSMEVAIRTSAIIAGLLTAVCSAQLVFFNTENRYAPYLPKNIEEVLQLAVDTQAGGGTTPAASLWPFYEKKEVVKTFIVVTDEEENGNCHNHRFADLYKLYHDEVYPAKLVFVSFLGYQHSHGQMVSDLERLDFKPLQFKFSRTMPDLTKLDKLFGLLSAGTASFDDEIATMEEKIKQEGLVKTFESIKI